MTILAKTAEHIAEFESGILTIARYSDGHCKAGKGRSIAGDFRSCIKSHGAERTIATYLRILPGEWATLYKPNRMQFIA